MGGAELLQVTADQVTVRKAVLALLEQRDRLLAICIGVLIPQPASDSFDGHYLNNLTLDILKQLRIGDTNLLGIPGQGGVDHIIPLLSFASFHPIKNRRKRDQDDSDDHGDEDRSRVDLCCLGHLESEILDLCVDLLGSLIFRVFFLLWTCWTDLGHLLVLSLFICLATRKQRLVQDSTPILTISRVT